MGLGRALPKMIWSSLLNEGLGVKILEIFRGTECNWMFCVIRFVTVLDRSPPVTLWSCYWTITLAAECRISHCI